LIPVSGCLSSSGLTGGSSEFKNRFPDQACLPVGRSGNDSD